jgi:hypothetical protein
MTWLIFPIALYASECSFLFCTRGERERCYPNKPKRALSRQFNSLPVCICAGRGGAPVCFQADLDNYWVARTARLLCKKCVILSLMGALSRLCYQAAFAFVRAERIIKAGNAEML